MAAVGPITVFVKCPECGYVGRVVGCARFACPPCGRIADTAANVTDAPTCSECERPAFYRLYSDDQTRYWPMGDWRCGLHVNSYTMSFVTVR